MPPDQRALRAKTKAVKSKKEPKAQRERSLRACTRCRQRKQKCDNALPDCSNCLKGGVRCEAFPVNVVSRDNLLQIYDQLLDSQRRNATLQKELEMARLVTPDALALFSAAIAQQITNGVYHGSSDRQQGSTSLPLSDLKAHSQSGTAPALINVGSKSDALNTSKAQSDATFRVSSGLPDIWKVIDLLEMCFPAVSAAISVAAEDFEQKPADDSAGNLADIALIPLRELPELLITTATSTCQARCRDRFMVTELSAEGWINGLRAASSMTRVAAALLWAVLAIVQHRGEELLRMDTVLTYFMQAWQASCTSTSVMASVYHEIPVSLRTSIRIGHVTTVRTSDLPKLVLVAQIRFFIDVFLSSV